MSGEILYYCGAMSPELSPPTKRITQLLDLVRTGDQESANVLAEMIYQELRRIAANRLRVQPNHAIQPTELVGLAYERLLENGKLDAANRRALFGLFKRSMRDVLVERWREAHAKKRGGDREHASGLEIPTIDSEWKVLVPELFEALDKLEAERPEEAEIVSLKFLCGLTIEEIAELTGIPPTTVQTKWQNARRWLYATLHGRPPIL